LKLREAADILWRLFLALYGATGPFRTVFFRYPYNQIGCRHQSSSALVALVTLASHGIDQPGSATADRRNVGLSKNTVMDIIRRETLAT
jgi:hypothetical protein